MGTGEGEETLPPFLSLSKGDTMETFTIWILSTILGTLFLGIPILNRLDRTR